MSEKLASAEARQAAHNIMCIPLQKRTEETMAQAIADSYAAVVRQLEETKDALEDFGVHRKDCTGLKDESDCTCGLNGAIHGGGFPRQPSRAEAAEKEANRLRTILQEEHGRTNL